MKCHDRKGLVRAVAEFVSGHGGNILHADHHIDSETQQFFSRVEWALGEFTIPVNRILSEFEPIGNEYAMDWQLRLSDEKPSVAIFVSKMDHCLLICSIDGKSENCPGRSRRS